MEGELRGRPRCEFVSASVSKGGSYYMVDCHGPGLPYSTLHSTRDSALVEVGLTRTYINLFKSD